MRQMSSLDASGYCESIPEGLVKVIQLPLPAKDRWHCHLGVVKLELDTLRLLDTKCCSQ